MSDGFILLLIVAPMSWRSLCWLLMLSRLLIVVEGRSTDWILYSYIKTDIPCLIHEFRYFCPSEWTSLGQTSKDFSCQFGQKWSFEFLKQQQITSDDLYRWMIPHDVIEQYASYLSNFIISTNDEFSICNCTSRRIGQNCEFQLEDNYATLQALITGQQGSSPIRDEALLTSFIDDIECEKNRELLQWRQICDGIVDCENGADEVNCHLLELHRCDKDEFQCRNGMCIPQEFAFDGMFDCLDSSDEQEIIENFELYHICPNRLDPVCDDRLCRKDEFSCGNGECVPWRALLHVQIGCSNLRHIAYRCDTVADKAIRRYISRGLCRQTTLPLPPLNSSESLNCLVGLRHLLLCNSQQQLNAMADLILHHVHQCPNLIEYPERPVISPVLHFFYNKSTLIDLLEERWYQAQHFPPRPDVVCLNGSMICDGISMSLATAHCMSYDAFLNLTTYPFLPIHSIFCEKAFEQHDDAIPNRHALHANPIRSMYRCTTTFHRLAVRRINDGYLDCPYGEDEKNSEFTVLQPYRYRCQTVSSPVQYVSFQQLGNDVKECDDGSDEMGLDLNWLLVQCHSFYHFACWVFKGDGISENRIGDVAIPFDRYCDARWDTWNGRDEQNCSQWVCAGSTVQCNRTGQCIDPNGLRNYEFDCDDGEDELHMFNKSRLWSLESLCNASTEHFCITPNYLDDRSVNRPCIPFTKAGDRIIDCIGGRDERNTFLCSDHTMLADRFVCDNQSKCLEHPAVCDGIPDCQDQTDETICPWDRGRCPAGSFSCADSRRCLTKRCTGSESCKDKSHRFWCPKLFNDSSTLLKNISKPSFYRAVCFKPLRNRPAALPEMLVDRLIGKVEASGYCNQGFYLKIHNTSKRVCFCPPTFYGDRCQYERRRVSIRYLFQRHHRVDLPRVIHTLVSLVYNRTTIIDHKSFIDVGEDFNTKSNIYLLYPLPRPYGEYSVRLEAYDSTQFLAGWEYPISPFDFLPVFRLTKLLRFPERPLPWYCTYNVCHNGGTCYVMNDHQQLCLCARGWNGQFCERKILQPIRCAPYALARDHDTCVCPYDYQRPWCFVRNTACNTSVRCHGRKACYPMLSEPASRYRCLCSDAYCDEDAPRIILHRERINQQPYLLQFLELEHDYPVVRHQILIGGSTHFPTERIIKVRGLGYTKYRMPPLSLFFTFQPQLHSVTRQLHILFINCTESVFNYTVHLDRDLRSCSPLNETQGRLVKSFHTFCRSPRNTSCFYSRQYLCLCNITSINRSECVPYVQQKIACNYCLNQGYCVQGDLQNKSDFACVCPTCTSGQLCQFSPSRFSISLELLMERSNRIYYHFIGAGVFFLLGMLSNGFSLITFVHPRSRQSGTGIYLLINGIVSQFLLTCLLVRVVYLYLVERSVIQDTVNLTLCRSLPLLMGTFNYISLWLMACVTVERALTGSFPTRFGRLRTPRSAVVVTIVLMLSTFASMAPYRDQYRLVTYPGNLYPWCVNEIKADRVLLIRIISLFHQITPFLINLIGGMTIIIVISRSKAALHHKAKRVTLAKQARDRVDLLLGPIICFITQFPQLSILFIDACIYDRKTWFLALTTLTFYLSFVPQISLFFMYVVVSPLFKEVFLTQTKASKQMMTRISTPF